MIKNIIRVAVLLTIVFGFTLSASAATFSSFPDLQQGSVSPYVVQLQKFLNTHGYVVNPTVGQSGSPGYESTSFGAMTKTALTKFQVKNAVVPANGIFASSTKAKMDKLSQTSVAKYSNAQYAVQSASGYLSVLIEPISLNPTVLGGHIECSVGGSAYGTCNRDFPDGSFVQVKAIPDAGYHFKGWNNGGVYNNVSLTYGAFINQNSPQAIYLAFEQGSAVTNYNLKAVVKNNAGGVIECKMNGLSISCGGSYPKDSLIELIASSAANYSIKEWSGNGLSGKNATQNIALNSDKVDIAVEFEQPTYKLTTNIINPDGGSVECSKDGLSVDCNGSYPASVIYIKATPKTNHTVKWSGNYFGVAHDGSQEIDKNQIAVTLGDGPEIITVEFLKAQYKLTFSWQDDRVHISGAASGNTFDAGTSVPLTVNVDPGYYLVALPDVLTGAKRYNLIGKIETSVVMDSDKNIDSSYAKEIPFLNVTTNTGSGRGTITADPISLGQNVTSINEKYIDAVKLVASPSDDSVFTEWKGDLFVVSPLHKRDNPISISSSVDNRAINAVFTKTKSRITTTYFEKKEDGTTLD
ncbi:MAG: peptidoglycan-binding domain-containing protein, partial [bacterium]